MKPVAVVKRSGVAHSRPVRHVEKGTEKPKKEYERRLVRALTQAQQPMSQDLWALDALNRQKIPSDDFQAIAAEAARLSHRRRRNAITRTDLCSALRGLYPVTTVPSSG